MNDEGTNGGPSLVFGVPLATALVVLAALAFLVLVRRGFRGVVVDLGA